jgi:hypothetical protein
MKRDIPDPAEMADAIDSKSGGAFQTDREIGPTDSGSKKRVTVTCLYPEPHEAEWTEVFRFLSANGYAPIEGQALYTIFAHPRDRTLRHLRGDGDVYEEHNAWEYIGE